MSAHPNDNRNPRFDRTDWTPLELKSDEAAARNRLRAFWAGSSLGDRPALHVLADRAGQTHGCSEEGPLSKESDLSSQWHIDRIERFLAATVFMAEAMPSADIMVGTDVTDTAVLLGGDYDYRYGEAIIRKDETVLEREVPTFDHRSPFVSALEQVYRDVAAHVGRRAFVNTTMTLDALTTLSLMVGHLELIRLMRSSPAVVEELIRAISHLLVEFHGFFYDLLIELGHGESSGWFHCMSEGPFDVLRSDFSVMLSPEMFARFAVPELTIRGQSLRHALFNMDSVPMVRFVDQLVDIPGLDGVLWNPGPSEGALTEHIPHLLEIRSRGLLLNVMAADSAEAARVAREVGPDGLMIALPRYSDEERAEEAIEEVIDAFR